MKKIFIILIFIAAFVRTNAQFPRVDIPGSEVRKITSSIVKGQEYELQILLPAGYKNSTKKYPVVYLMDSQWDFPLAKSIYGQQYYDGFIPELIIVGITWGGVNPNPDSLRVRDYTPTNDGRQKQSGGADQFLSFMKNELFPFIENNYRADSIKRTLMGCSLGGLITLYALFTHSEMFMGYVAASPAIGWGNEVIYQYEKSFYEKQLFIKKRFSQRLYMTVGGVERGVPGFEKLAALLVSRNYNAQQVYIQSKVLENTGHSGTKSETFSRGLQFAFERPDLNPDNSLLKKYAGFYELSDGRRAEIIINEKKLMINFGNTNSYWLYAASEVDFYSTAEFLNIHFKTEDGKVKGFQLDKYGSSQFVTKADQ
jgi:predicted alpha/beta superfamily hydrolase